MVIVATGENAALLRCQITMVSIEACENMIYMRGA